MNKMDDFFKKRLENYSPAEDGWNIPSDDIFNKAKVHFPKKKKKKRFLWLLFIPALILFSGVGYYLGKNSIDETTQISSSPEIASEKIIDPHFSSTKNNSSKSENKTDLKNIKSEDQQPSQKTSTNLITKNNPTKTSIITQPTTLKSTETKQIITAAEIQNEVKVKPTNVLPSITKNENKLKLENTEIAAEDETINASTHSVEKLPVPGIVEVSTAAALIPTKYPSIIENKNIAPSFQSPAIIIPKRQRLPKSEIGLAFGETIFRLLEINGTIDEPDGTYLSLDLNYTNPNFYYTRWFAKKWSWTTGLRYSYFDLKLDLSVFQEFTQNDIDAYSSYGSFFGVKRNSGEPITGVEINPGDTINIQANIAQIGHEVQLPLFVNFHLRKKRFEWRFTAGIALNILNMKVDQVFNNLYKDGNLISTPEWEPQLGWHLYGSAHVGVSMRYHINNRFNLGLSPRIDLTNPIFSGMEVGIYYRL